MTAKIGNTGGDVFAVPYLDFDPPIDRPGDPLELAALAFHRTNPHVLRAVADVCLRVQRAGRAAWSINAAFEVVRYNAEVSRDGRVYKLNNSYRAQYARWIMRDIPALAGFFRTRESGRVRQDYGAGE